MAFSVRAQRLVEVGKGFSSTSVNTTVFRNNSIVTHGNTQYISYYDAEGWLMLGKRRLGTGEWILHRTQYKGHVKDAHNIISMMVDGDGYLHLSFDHHGHKLNYCRSIAPDTLVLGDKEPMIGNEEEDVTYPEFHLLADGGLLFVYRSGASGRGNMVMNRYDVKSRKWERVQDVLVDGENERNAYWQLYVDQSGTIHLSWVWRETWHVETNHDLCYARSFDGGRTWYKTNGQKYELPIRLGNAEYACRIPQNAELINQTSMRGCLKIELRWPLLFHLQLKSFGFFSKKEFINLLLKVSSFQTFFFVAISPLRGYFCKIMCNGQQAELNFNLLKPTKMEPLEVLVVLEVSKYGFHILRSLAAIFQAFIREQFFTFPFLDFPQTMVYLHNSFRPASVTPTS